MTIRNVPGTGYGELLVNAGDGPTMVINRDETHLLFVGDDNSIASKQGTGDIDIIDPLSFIVYDGINTKYGIADTPGITIQVDSVKGATNWSPSPAQAAFQISTLGLATAANQQTTQTTLVNGIGLPTGAAKDSTVSSTNSALTTGIALPVGAAKDSTLTTGIALPVGAAKDSSVATTNTNTSNINQAISLGTNPSVAAINSNHAGQQSASMNPFFTGPGGVADTSGWGAGGNTLQSAGNLGAVSLPLGSGYINGVFMTPDGAHSFSAINPSQLMPVQPGQTPYCHYVLSMNGGQNSSPALQAAVNFQYYNSAGTFVANHIVTVTYINGNTYCKIITEDDLGAPATAAGVLIIPQYQTILGGNIAASQTAYITAVITGILGNVGTMGGDHSRHHAIAGTPLLHGWSFIDGPLVAVPANSQVTKSYNNLVNCGYEIAIWPQYHSASGTSPFIQLIMRWIDRSRGIFMGEEHWTIPASASGGFLPVYGKGPIKAPSLDIILTNTDINQQIDVPFEITQTTHHVARDDWRGAPPVVPTFTAAPGADPFGLKLLATGTIMIPASSSVTYLMPLFAGPVFISSQCTPSANSTTLTIATARNASQQLYFASITPTVNNVINASLVTLPREPCVLIIANTNTNATQIQVTITAQEFVS